MSSRPSTQFAHFRGLSFLTRIGPTSSSVAILRTPTFLRSLGTPMVGIGAGFSWRDRAALESRHSPKQASVPPFTPAGLRTHSWAFASLSFAQGQIQ